MEKKAIPVLKFESELLKKEQLSDNTIEFTFSTPKEFTHDSGQFVMLESMGSEGKLVKRAFSIASIFLSRDSLRLCIKILPDGRLSYPLSQLEVGAKVNMQGPYGKFVLEDIDKKMLFVAAGTGIAPLYSMAQHMIVRGVHGPITVVYGFRTPRDYLYKKWFEHHAKNFPEEIKIIPVCSTPDESWTGEVGHVQDVLKKHFPDGAEYDAYLCGPPKMVAETVALLTKQNFKKIYREAWG